MQCPTCGDEYEDHVDLCVRCRVPLAPPGAAVPLRTRHLGRFVDPVGQRVLEVLRAQGVDYEFDRHDDRDLTIRVHADWRDDVASQLYSGWAGLLAGLEPEDARLLYGLGGTHPGWLDAPTEAWADRAGRLQVAIEAEGDPDTARALGPGLAVIGLAMVLLGLAGAVTTGTAVTFGLALLVLGVLLPR